MRPAATRSTSMSAPCGSTSTAMLPTLASRRHGEVHARYLAAGFTSTFVVAVPKPWRSALTSTLPLATSPMPQGLTPRSSPFT